MNGQRLDDRLVAVTLVPAALARGEMTRRAVLGVAAAACVVMRRPVAVAARAATDQAALVDLDVLERGAVWLQAQQAPDGGYPNLRGDVTIGATGDAVNALVALGNVGIEVETEAAVAYLEENVAAGVETLAGGAGRAAMAVAAAGADPSDVGGTDLVAMIAESWDEDTGSYGADLISNIYALLGLAAAGEEVPEEAIAALESSQLDDGAWSFDGMPGSGDAVMTAFVVQTLAAAGRSGEDASIAGAIDFLRTVQVDGGAFAYSAGAPPDANTTGLIVSALTAAGEDVGGEWGGAVAALSAFQNESGAFRYTDLEPGDDILITTVALLALAGGALPVRPVE